MNDNNEMFNEEQAKFEAWASNNGYNPWAIERCSNGDYIPDTAAKWQAWQARASLAAQAATRELSDEEIIDIGNEFGVFAILASPFYYVAAVRAILAKGKS